MNLKLVATTATKAEIGTASAMSSWKNISMIGMLLPAPESPPAFERAIKMNIRTHPMVSVTGLVNGIFCIFSCFTESSAAVWSSCTSELGAA